MGGRSGWFRSVSVARGFVHGQCAGWKSRGHGSCGWVLQSDERCSRVRPSRLYAPRRSVDVDDLVGEPRVTDRAGRRGPGTPLVVARHRHAAHPGRDLDGEALGGHHLDRREPRFGAPPPSTTRSLGERPRARSRARRSACGKRPARRCRWSSPRVCARCRSGAGCTSCRPSGPTPRDRPRPPPPAVRTRPDRSHAAETLADTTSAWASPRSRRACPTPTTRLRHTGGTSEPPPDPGRFTLQAKILLL